MVEAGIALLSVGVEDSQLGSPPRRTEPVARHRDLRPLTHDVAPEPDPGAVGQLEAQAGRVGDGRGQPAVERRRFEDDEEGVRAAGERGKPAEPVVDAGGVAIARPAGGQIDEQEVDGAGGEQAAGHRQALVERLRREHDEPFETDAAGDRLDRVEAARQVQPGDDRAVRLGLGGEPERDGRPAARPRAAERDAGRARDAARSENRVEVHESGPDDALPRDIRRGDRLGGQRDRGEGPDHVPGESRSCRAPARLEGRQGGRHVRVEGSHRPAIIERLF